MNFEISIQGPKAEIIRLYKRLKSFSPHIRNLTKWSEDGPPDRLEIILRKDLEPSLLDRELMSISGLMTDSARSAAKQDLFDMRVRNLDYSEPSSGSDGFFEPFRPASCLLVEPWSPRPGQRRKADCIYLDPGHAFGTGKHPTTRLCLQILEGLIPDGPMIERALDLGCGTGILALAAVKLGVRRALGVETDMASARTATRNIRLNRLEQRIEIRQGSWDRVEGLFDLILANLVASALLRIGGRISGHLKDGGWAVVSGFGENQVGEVLSLLENSGLVLERQLALNGWAGFVLRKKAGPPGAERLILSSSSLKPPQKRHHAVSACIFRSFPVTNR